MITILLIAAASTASILAPEPPIVAQIEEALDRGRLIQASEMIGIAARDDKVRRSAPFLRATGRLALVQNRPGDAFLAYKQANEASQGDCLSFEGMGLSALKLGRVNAAIAAAQDATKRCPDRWQSWNLMGIIADRAGDWELSRIAYLKALEVTPESPRVLNNAGYSMLLQKRFADAEVILRKAKELAPNDARIANNLDLALAGGGKALDDMDVDASRLNNAGYMAYLTGQYDIAQRYLSQAIDKSSVRSPVAEANLELVESASRK